MSHDYDIPVVHHIISLRSPRAVLLLNPTLPIVVALLIVSLMFTIWPEALEHSPINFERRGILHHVWHYTLLAGAVLALVGMFATFRRRLQFELSGTFLLIGALGMNLVALISETVHPAAEVPSGLAVGVRSGVIVMLSIRAYILLFEPTVQMPNTHTREGTEP